MNIHSISLPVKALTRHYIIKPSVKSPYRQIIEDAERAMIEEAMLECDYNQTMASRALGMNRGTLRKKLKQFGMIV